MRTGLMSDASEGRRWMDGWKDDLPCPPHTGGTVSDGVILANPNPATQAHEKDNPTLIIPAGLGGPGPNASLISSRSSHSPFFPVQ